MAPSPFERSGHEIVLSDRVRRPTRRHHREVPGAESQPQIISESAATKEVCSERIASTENSFPITDIIWTGQELATQAMDRNSRRDRSMLVNCSTLPEAPLKVEFGRGRSSPAYDDESPSSFFKRCASTQRIVHPKSLSRSERLPPAGAKCAALRPATRFYCPFEFSSQDL